MHTHTLRLEGQDCADPGLRGRRARALLVVGAVVMALVPSVGVTGALAAGSGVAVFPGDSIQALVNANPAGTTFLIKAGIHHAQMVIPKNGNSFVGESGAILDGDGTAAYAFVGMPGSIKGVTLRNLVVQNYATGDSGGAIRTGPGGEAFHWTVEGCDIHHNTGMALHLDNGAGWQIRNNHIHHNGKIGVVASGDDIVIEGNEIAFNNTGGHDPYWEAGGTKFVYTTNLVVRNNYVHDNAGPGLWTDINNINTLYEGNRVIGNDGPGIFHEISYDAVIRNNTVEGNGFGFTAWIDGAGILVSSSPNVEIYGNTVRYNNDGIAAKHGTLDQADAKYGPWQLKNLWVHDNVIVMDAGQTGVVRDSNNSDPVWGPSWNNRFDYNTYTLDTGDDYYVWDPWIITTAQWRAFGQDSNGTWTTVPPTTTTTVPPTTTTTTVPPPVPPTCNGLPATRVGTDGDDIIIGTPGPDVIVALGGDDVVEAGDGYDVICGGPGDDTLKGGPGDDVLIGGAGRDSLHGQAGNDTLVGKTGQDRLIGGTGGDRLHGGPDNDVLRGGPGTDILRGGDGSDLLAGGEGHDRIFGGSGPDRLAGHDGNDTLNGQTGDDWLCGGPGADILNGGLGRNTIRGRQEEDTMIIPKAPGG